MKNLEFGADGIRGVAGEWPLDAAGSERLGHVLGWFLARRSDALVAVLGRDTRPSGEMILNGLKIGLRSQGIDVVDLELMTTPGVAYLTRYLGADLGIVVSASHNPVEYNGVKLVDRSGLRLQREDEIEIEILFNSGPQYGSTMPERQGQITQGGHLIQLYIDQHVQRCPAESLDGMKMVLDCAGGAASYIAPEAFSRLGAEVIAINTSGTINRAAGSEYVRSHPEELIGIVRSHGAIFGFALDGDGDRLVVVDSSGCLYNGDDMLFAIASHFRPELQRQGDVVVGTHLSNSGLETALNDLGVRLVRAGKGDRALEAEMWHGGHFLGGEQTGNIIINDGHHTAADAVYTAIVIAGILADNPEADFGTVVAQFRKHPQLVASVRLSQTPPLEHIVRLQAYRKRVSDELGETCRIMMWYSSTEPGLFKVMIEGPPGSSVSVMRERAESICQLMQRVTESGGRIALHDASTRYRL